MTNKVTQNQISHVRELLLCYISKKVISKLQKLTNYKSNYTSTMYMKVITSLCKRIANNGKNNVDTMIFSQGSCACQHAMSPLRQAPRLPLVLLLVVTHKSHSPTWSAYLKL